MTLAIRMRAIVTSSVKPIWPLTAATILKPPHNQVDVVCLQSFLQLPLQFQKLLSVRFALNQNSDVDIAALRCSSDRL